MKIYSDKGTEPGADCKTVLILDDSGRNVCFECGNYILGRRVTVNSYAKSARQTISLHLFCFNSLWKKMKDFEVDLCKK